VQAQLGDSEEQQQQPGVVAAQRRIGCGPAGQPGGLAAWTGSSLAGGPRRPSSRRGNRGIPSASRICQQVCSDSGRPSAVSAAEISVTLCPAARRASTLARSSPVALRVLSGRAGGRLVPDNQLRFGRVVKTAARLPARTPSPAGGPGARNASDGTPGIEVSRPAAQGDGARGLAGVRPQWRGLPRAGEACRDLAGWPTGGMLSALPLPASAGAGR